jgi:N-acetylmuramoyl-L-alanine amidase
MIVSKKTAKIAVASLLLAMTATGSATAFGAASDEIVDGFSLLPQSVRDAAVDEAQSPSDYSLIPEVRFETIPTKAKKSNLVALVETNSADTAIDSEEKCLASAIFYEARSESFEGQLAVAQVILNRLESGRFARSICGVVLQSGQFSFVRGGTIPAINKGSTDWREALAIARIAQAKLHRSGANDALFFHATHVSPKWRLSRVASIGNHVFYR